MTESPPPSNHGGSGSIRSLARAVTGPRGRWATIAIWIALVVGGLIARAHLNDATSAGQSSFLPSGAQSTRVVDLLQRDYKGGDNVPVLIVFERDRPLDRSDLRAIGRLGKGLDRLRITGATPVFDPISEGTGRPLRRFAGFARGIGPISRNGKAALVALGIDAADRGAILAGVKEIESFLAHHRVPGMNAYVTGPGGIAADLEQVASEAGRTLLFATLGLVLVLLLVVYRAPILALLPLLSVGAAYLIAVGITYLAIKAGLITVNTEGTLLLLVLIFGAGTDYSLLLVHRYREELGAGREPREALPEALAESLPAIAASAGTVIAAMLVLLLADLQSTHWLGPVLAIGIAVMLISSFTLLPAILSLLGERAFWPGRGPAEPESSRRWARVAELVRRRPRAIVAVVCAALAVLSLGNLVSHSTIGFGQGETRPSDSSRGTAALNANFPPGLGSPLTALVGLKDVGRAIRGLEALPTVKLAFPVPPSGSAEMALVPIILRGDPYSSQAAEAVEEIRDTLDRVGPRVPGRRHPGRELRHRDHQRAGHEDYRPRRPDRRRTDPRPRAQGAGRARLPDRHRRRIFRRHHGPDHLRFHGGVRVERHRLQPRPDGVHLPGRPGGRLQHLPDGARPRGGGECRNTRGASSWHSRTPAVWSRGPA